MPLIEELLELDIPSGAVEISPNGEQVVYRTTLSGEHKKGEHLASALWAAKIGEEKSAHRITSGKFNDGSPTWNPDGKSVAFLSDRGKQGESSAIYVLPMTVGGEAYPITPEENEAAIDEFSFSPDGKFIAYNVADEKSDEKKAKEKEKDDPNVWNEDLRYARLKLVHVSTKKVTTLISNNRHIYSLTWNEDGTKIVVCQTKTPRIDSSAQHGTDICIVDIASKTVKDVCHFPSGVADLLWIGNSLYFVGNVTPELYISSSMVYSIDLSAEKPEYRKRAHGETDCADSIVKVGSEVVVGAISGVGDDIHVLDGKSIIRRDEELAGWDIKVSSDKKDKIIALISSSTKQPREVYSTTASGGKLTQLSTHGESLTKEHIFGEAETLSCKSADGKVQLDALYFSPAKKDKSGTRKPLPTLVVVHGGPYYRTTNAFNIQGMWSPLLLAHGYGILAPNYRGGSGHGEAFAACSRGGIGTVDYDDVITLTQHAIEQGLADKDRLMIGGWSQGGFMSYISSVRNGMHGHGWKFKAAIPGAGVSDADTMIYTSDLGSTFELELAGKTPWRTDRNDVSNRQGSAIWEFKKAMDVGNVVPPMLILHGEKDPRCPFEQAVMVRRALEDYGLPFEFVSYPREGHGLKERKHYIDVLQRVLRWVDTHIGGKAS